MVKRDSRTVVGGPRPVAFHRCLAGTILVLLVAGCARPGGGIRGNGAKPNAPPRLPQYADVTAKAGIHFTHVNGASERRYVPETMGAGCAFIDFDQDGW